MSRTILSVLVGVLFIFIVAALLTGEAIWVVPVLVLLGVVAVAGAGHLGLRKHVENVDGDTTLPAAHIEAEDDATDLGDTEQAHDEVSPHDLPKAHPGRIEAEYQAGERFDRSEGVTRGDREGAG